jgi:hypothetical protein
MRISAVSSAAIRRAQGVRKADLKIARAATPMSIWVSVSLSAATAKAKRLGLYCLCP